MAVEAIRAKGPHIGTRDSYAIIHVDVGEGRRRDSRRRRHRDRSVRGDQPLPSRATQSRGTSDGRCSEHSRQRAGHLLRRLVLGAHSTSRKGGELRRWIRCQGESPPLAWVSQDTPLCGGASSTYDPVKRIATGACVCSKQARTGMFSEGSHCHWQIPATWLPLLLGNTNDG